MIRSMKTLGAALGVTAMLAGASAAQAAITFDPDGAGVAGAVGNVTQLDWAPGNGLSVGGQTAISNFVAGSGSTTFTTYYQSKLQAFSTAGGTSFAPAGWEITIVAKFNEQVTGVLGNLAAFEVVNVIDDPNYIEIYAHRIGDAGTSVASNLDGTGFNDGNLILTGSITGGTSLFSVNPANIQNLDNNGTDNYPTIDSVTSTNGSITVQSFDVNVTGFDPAYFLSSLTSLSLDFVGTAQLPYTNLDPSARFLVGSNGTADGYAPVLAGAGAPLDPVTGIGPINGLSGPSVQFAVDGNSSIDGVSNPIPEPATAAMGLFGLAGLALAARRRR